MTGSGPRHAWTDNDRAALALLYRLYSNEKSKLLKIFNKINHHVLSAEGFPGGSMPVTTLMTQYHQMKKNQNVVFRRVSNMPLPALRRHYRGLKDSIEDGAQALNINLELRVEASTQPTGQQTQPSTRETSNNAVQRDAWSATTDSSDDEARLAPPITQWPPNRQLIRTFAFSTDAVVERATPATAHQNTAGAGTLAHTQLVVNTSADDRSPSLRHVPLANHLVFDGVYVPTTTMAPRTPSPSSFLANVRSSPRLRSDFNSDGSHGRFQHPVILFRAFDPELGFTARRFGGSETISSPPAGNSDEFKALVIPHVSVEHFASPFISLSQYPLNVLKRISTSEVPKSFAVFLYSDLDDEGRKRNKMRPCLVPKLCDRLDLNGRLPNRYRGRGEFLTWGRIDSKPLLILHTGPALELYGTLNSMRKNKECCSPEAGAKLLPFLESVDADHRETVLRQLVSSFKIHGYDWNYHSPRWEAFADMLYPDQVDREQRYRRADSVFSAITIHHSPSQAGEAFLLVQDENAEEDNVDYRATEEYLQHVLRQPDDDADNDDEDLSVDHDQAAVDAQLLAEVRAYHGNEAGFNTTTSEQPETTSAHEPIETDDSAARAVPDTTSLHHSPSKTVTPTGYSEPRNNKKPDNVIDLTSDSVMADDHQPEQTDDLIVINDMEDDNDVILVYPAPRRLPIRSPSVFETPTRPSRYADRHIHVLD